MKKLLVIAAFIGAALWVGVAPAEANPTPDDDEQSQVAKKRRDGGTRDEED
ncbi:MAG: hypothetical protein JNK82_24375 [Myxococcaceae bacterium]|nr:hypothetical protein [Myxococcaceae bacterium]